jgi:hypothetical protein
MRRRGNLGLADGSAALFVAMFNGEVGGGRLPSLPKLERYRRSVGLCPK